MARRLGVIAISPEVFLGLLASLDGTRRPRFEGLPVDCRVVGFHADHERRALCLIIEAPDLDQVEDGDAIPRLTLVFEEASDEAQAEMLALQRRTLELVQQVAANAGR